jgi:hypothetical protein
MELRRCFEPFLDNFHWMIIQKTATIPISGAANADL